MKRLLCAIALVVLTTPALRADNGIRPGEFIIEPPTLICLGFEWAMSGDDNRNATVDVSYRREGDSQWRDALPLLRMGGEKIFRAPYTVPDRFAGSILDLEPGTAYEVRLTMKDPDGVSGQAVQLVKARTRAEPTAAPGGRVLHVYPPTWRGAKEEPNFTGLMAAYAGAGTGDWNVVFQNKVGPGDVILVHAGLYKGDRRNYVDPLSTTFDGAYLLTAKGTPERPIVIKAAGDGEVIFDGDGAFRLFDVMAADYNIFDGLTIRNTEVAFWAGVKDVAGAKGLAVRNCRIENVGVGVVTQFAGSKDFYIADNIFLGRDDRQRVLGWASPGLYGAHPINSYFAVKVYGSGHVIAHNSVAFFHDGISVCTHGVPEPEQDLKAVAIDIYNNDIHVTGDDFIEADGGVHNIRVLRNRGINAAHTALSAQPIFGGPAYYIRNIVYNTPVALKFANPAGVVVLHNTFIAENRTAQRVSNADFRNNLFLGTDARAGIAVLGGPTAYSTYDYNGYRPNRGADPQYTWLGPKPGVRVDYDIEAKQAPRFATLAELAAATGQETHGLEVDYDVFEDLRAPAPPDSSKPGRPYEAASLNFRLKPGSRAVDAGVRLPNVNDEFSGRAPDLGAYEVGQPALCTGRDGSRSSRSIGRRKDRCQSRNRGSMKRIASTNAWSAVGLTVLALATGFTFAKGFTVVSAQQPGPQRTLAPSTDGRLNVIAFGAHPDDCDLRAGGTAIKLAKLGHRVRFVSVTNGDAGHQTEGGGALAARRRDEAREAGRRAGVEYITLDNHDGELIPTLKPREDVIRQIRLWNADLVLAPRPNDYHPDHRYTGVLVQDAAYMVVVPNITPDTPALRKNPVFMYFQDNFQRPNAFRPDVAIAIDDVIDTKIDMLDAHVSQFYEWLPWVDGMLEKVPKGAADRKRWLKEVSSEEVSPAVRATLTKWYGAERAKAVRHAEAFEICEYGARPDDTMIRKLFPFFQ